MTQVRKINNCFMQKIALLCICLFPVSFSFIPLNLPSKGLEDCTTTKEDFRAITNCGISVVNDTTVIEITTKGVELSYSVTEIRAKAGDLVRIRYINESDMSHNIVLLKSEEDIRPVGIAALQAVMSDWIPENEKHRIIAHSDLAYSEQTVEFSFRVPPPGTYPYICTYSAHWTQMRGRLISTK
ncbi:MAG: plastocyanin/azurin family copper-binding protein [Cyclobacteriaceae bacterium]